MSAQERATREEEEATAAAEREAAEKLAAEQARIVKPVEQANARMAILAKAAAELPPPAEHSRPPPSSDLAECCRCLLTQLDEIMALQAIYEGTDTLLLPEALDLEAMREQAENVEASGFKDTDAIMSLTKQPLACIFQLTVTMADHQTPTEGEG